VHNFNFCAHKKTRKSEKRQSPAKAQPTATGWLFVPGTESDKATAV